MTFEEAITEFQRRVSEKGLGDLQGTYVFDLGSSGIWHLRRTGENYEFVPFSPLCTFKASPEVFLQIVEKPSSVLTLCMQKKLVFDNMPEAIRFAKEAAKLL